MSEEKTQVQNARKDLDILNKMKNLPGGLVIIPLVIAVVLATFEAGPAWLFPPYRICWPLWGFRPWTHVPRWDRYRSA